MKKLFVIALLCYLWAGLFAERVYKTFTAGGKTVSGYFDVFYTWYQYDSKGNMLKSWDSEKYLEKSEYDDQNRRTYYKNYEDRYEVWNEYDSFGNLSYHKEQSKSFSKPIEKIHKYNEKNQLVYVKETGDFFSNDIEYTNFYNKKGQLVRVESPDNPTTYFEYDRKGNRKKMYDDKGNYETYRYDKKGNLIYVNRFYFSMARESWKKYDDLGNMIYEELSDGSWTEYQFDERGNQTFYQNSRGKYKTCKYDSNNNVIYEETGPKNIIVREYDDYGNVTYYKNYDISLENFYEYDYDANHKPITERRYVKASKYDSYWW